ncbi:MAG: hypothetical protein QOD06_2129 [Candidatus Binatota bacterium]|jgi:hypothetical protein|nr:hypothetical protein [Candidatus Binatota bacterium]
MHRRFLLSLLCSTVCLAPSLAAGQAGVYVTPSLTAEEEYDDNVFSVPDEDDQVVPEEPPGQQPGTSELPRGREDDFIFRATPGVEAGYSSEPVSVVGRYRVDAEQYVNHSDLSDGVARQNGSVRATYLPNRRLTTGLEGGFSESKRPRDLNQLIPSGDQQLPGTGLEDPRARVRRYFATPNVSFRWTRRLSTDADYSYERSEEVGGVTSDTHAAGARINRRITRRDTVDVGYGYRNFQFEEARPAPAPGTEPVPDPESFANQNASESHVVSFGWTREFTPRVEVVLRGGPRFTEGAIDADALARLRYALERGDLSVQYTRTENTAVGELGAVRTDSVVAGIGYEVGRGVSLQGAVGYARNETDSFDADVYSANVGVDYQTREWLKLFVSYDFSLQQESFSTGADGRVMPDQDTLHNLGAVGFTITYPYRVY